MPRAAFTEGVSDTDPHASLEKVLDEDNLKWVEEQNKVTVDRLGEIRGTKTYERILEALDSKDKIPAAYEIGDKLYNFWQDDQHVQGIWRRASLDSYKSDNVAWETVLDIDALPPPTKDTAKTWVWHGSNLLDDGQFDRCLISLSPGGSDADTTREFCLKNGDKLPPQLLQLCQETSLEYLKSIFSDEGGGKKKGKAQAGDGLARVLSTLMHEPGKMTPGEFATTRNDMVKQRQAAKGKAKKLQATTAAAEPFVDVKRDTLWKIGGHGKCHDGAISAVTFDPDDHGGHSCVEAPNPCTKRFSNCEVRTVKITTHDGVARFSVRSG